MADGKLQTLDRGILALQLLARNSGGLKVGELAKDLGIAKPIAYRIVATLMDRKMVQRVGDGRIVLGLGALLLGVQASGGILDVARVVAERLAERTGATAFLSMAQGDEYAIVLTAQPRDSFMNIQYQVGTRHPIGLGAAGIAILATRPARADDSEYVRFARENGYSITRGQLQRGAVGVASGVRLPFEGFPGMEFSIGVVALESLDIDVAAAEVPDAARVLSKSFGVID